METIENKNFAKKRNLPNATAVLVLGIVSIVICLLGFITGTIALVLASRDLKEYRKNPELYSESSFKNLNAGRICAIIGVCLSVLTLIFYILYFILVLSIVNKAIDFSHDNFNNIEQWEDSSDNNDLYEEEGNDSEESILEEIESVEDENELDSSN